MDAEALPAKRSRRLSEKRLAAQKQESVEEARKRERERDTAKTHTSIPREVKIERDATPQKQDTPVQSSSPSPPPPPPPLPQPEAGPSRHTAEEDAKPEHRHERGDAAEEEEEAEGESEIEEGESEIDIDPEEEGESELDDEGEGDNEHGNEAGTSSGKHVIRGYLTCPPTLWALVETNPKWDAIAVEEWVREQNRTSTTGVVYKIDAAGIAALKSKYFFERKRRRTGKGRDRPTKRGPKKGAKGKAPAATTASKAATVSKIASSSKAGAGTSKDAPKAPAPAASSKPLTLRFRIQPPASATSTTSTTWWKAQDNERKPGDAVTSTATSPGKRGRDKVEVDAQGPAKIKRQKTETEHEEPRRDWSDSERDEHIPPETAPADSPAISFMRSRSASFSDISNRGFDTLLEQIDELKEFDYEYVGSLMETHYELQQELESLETAVDLSMRYRARLAGPGSSPPRTSSTGPSSTSTSTNLVLRIDGVLNSLNDLKAFHPDHIGNLMERHDAFRKRLASFMDDIDLGFEYRDSVFENIDGRRGS